MHRLYPVLLILPLMSASPVLRAQQPVASPADQYDQLRSATQLDRKGAQPFHLKVAAKVNDLEGGGSKPGIIEAWWVSPDEYRIEINSGSLHIVTATGEPDTPSKPTRAGYLLSELYDATVHPLQPSPSGNDVTETNRKLGKIELTCFRPHTPLSPTGAPLTACTETGTEKLRFVLREYQVIVRNPVTGHGHPDSGISTTISYSGRDAISGTITTLEPFTPGAPGTPALTPNPPKSSAGPTMTRIAANVLSGKRIKNVQPEYPADARDRHVGGTVLLHAIITKQGTIGSLIVLASPDPSLSAAAQAAVSQWRYQPYLLNGQPTAVDTTIQVNFYLNHS